MSGMPRSRVTLVLIALIVLVIVMWLTHTADRGHCDSVILRAMQTASGNKSGHIVALIAVGFSAVADVCCCR